MTGLLALLIGTVLLWLVWSERREIPRDWEKPARWWKLPEHMEARAPSQPLNVVIGTVLGVCALAYGVVVLVASRANVPNTRL